MREAASEDQTVRTWALARLVEAGDLTRFDDLAKELAAHIKESVLSNRVWGDPRFAEVSTIHHTSPFFPALERTIRENPEYLVPSGLYVVWCYNTLPNQRDLIYAIAARVKSSATVHNRHFDPWNDPRFWIVTDWALAWGEPADFEALPQLFQDAGAQREFHRIAQSVTRVPGFFSCRNRSPLSSATPGPVDPPAAATASSAPAAPLSAGERKPNGQKEPMEDVPRRFVDLDFKQIKIKARPMAPAYPAEAKARRMMTTLKVQIEVGTDGKVCGARTAPGPFLAFFAPTALEYASRWTWEPAQVLGTPVAARFTLTMPFRLR